MNPLIEEVVEALRGAGWTVTLNGKPQPLPASVVNRHPRLPALAVEFFSNVHSCVEPAEGAWFLAAEDFARTDGFRWDEYERMFLDDADEDQVREVRAFWDRYLPIFQLVEGDYEFLAIGTDPSSSHFGKVVWGAEAAYDEDPLVITRSYEDFLVRLRDVARRDPRRTASADLTIARLIHADIEDVPQNWWTRLKGWLKQSDYEPKN